MSPSDETRYLAGEILIAGRTTAIATIAAQRIRLQEIDPVTYRDTEQAAVDWAAGLVAMAEFAARRARR